MQKKINGYIDDETQIKICSQYTGTWVAIDPKHRQTLHIGICFEKTKSLVIERFIASSIEKYDKPSFFEWWHMISMSSLSSF
jgi:transposase-like protein